jgi:zinc protease
MAAYVVNHIVGGGSFSSRLYREVREKRGLAYSVYQGLVWLKQSAAFYGGTATRADRAGETIALIEQELRRIASEGPTEKELDEAKSYLKGSQMLSLDTSSKIASQLVQYQIDELGIDYIEKRNGLIDAITLADAKRVAQRLLGNGMLMTVVGRDLPPASPPKGN